MSKPTSLRPTEQDALGRMVSQKKFVDGCWDVIDEDGEKIGTVAGDSETEAWRKVGYGDWTKTWSHIDRQNEKAERERADSAAEDTREEDVSAARPRSSASGGFLGTAAGCFGCLALVFFVLNFVTGIVLVPFMGRYPEWASPLAAVSWISGYVNPCCCCLSGALSIILLAVGMSRGNTDSRD